MLWLALMNLGTAAPQVTVLDGPQATWQRTLEVAETQQDPGSIDLRLDYPATLDSGSMLTVRIDGRPLTTVALDGTPVPPVPLPALEEGSHTLEVRTRLFSSVDDCAPEDRWITLQPTLSGEWAATDPTPTPSGVAQHLATHGARVEGAFDLGRLSVHAGLRSWGVETTPDASRVLWMADRPDTLLLDWDEGLVVHGPAASFPFVSPAEVERCPDWPCILPIPSRESLPPPDTLGGLGHPYGIQLRPSEDNAFVFPTPGDTTHATVHLDVVRSAAATPGQVLHLRVGDIAVGSWLVDDIEPEGGQLVASVPVAVHDATGWRFTVELEQADGSCEPLGRDWIRIEPTSHVEWTGEQRPGIAGFVKETQSSDSAALCLQGIPSDASAQRLGDLLFQLRPENGWVEDCISPQVRVTDEAPEAWNHAGGSRWGLFDHDAVASSPDRWILGVEEGLMTVVYGPSEAEAVALDTLRLPAATTTNGAWSSVGTPEERVRVAPKPTPEVASVASTHQRRVDLLLSMVLVLGLMAGGLWLWRSRGSDEEWLPS